MNRVDVICFFFLRNLSFFEFEHETGMTQVVLFVFKLISTLMLSKVDWLITDTIIYAQSTNFKIHNSKKYPVVKRGTEYIRAFLHYLSDFLFIWSNS